MRQSEVICIAIIHENGRLLGGTSTRSLAGGEWGYSVVLGSIRWMRPRRPPPPDYARGETVHDQYSNENNLLPIVCSREKAMYPVPIIR